MVDNYHCQIGFNSCGQKQFIDFWGISVNLIYCQLPNLQLLILILKENKTLKEKNTPCCCKTPLSPSLFSSSLVAGHRWCRRWGSVCGGLSTSSALVKVVPAGRCLAAAPIPPVYAALQGSEVPPA